MRVVPNRYDAEEQFVGTSRLKSFRLRTRKVRDTLAVSRCAHPHECSATDGGVISVAPFPVGT